MLITRVEIERFRCVFHDTLECDSLTALVGRNGAGKSCYLHALRLFYAVSPSITDEDFYNRQTGEPIQIRVTFRNLLQQEEEAFRTYLDGDALIVTKKIWWADGKVLAKTYGASRQHPEFARIRAIDDKRTIRIEFNALVDAGTFEGLERASGAPDAEVKMAAWEAANPAACQPIEREAQFLGPAAIGVGSLDNFTKFVFIPAVRDVADETGDTRGSALAGLLNLVVNERVENRPDLQALRVDLKARYETIFAGGEQPELRTLGTEISRVLDDFHPGAAVELGWRKPTPPELGLPGVDPTVIEDGFKGHVTRKGHGLQRALVLALLQARAKTTGPAPAVGDGEQAALRATDTAAPRRRLILVIEEPELYQHPQQCRHWARVLSRITTAPDGEVVPDTQVIFSTHSPYFVDLSWFDRVRVVRKKPADAGAPPIAKATHTTLDAVGQELAAATNRPAADVTAQTTRARARPVMTNLVNEGFFATVAVLVEGGTEVGLLEEVARRKGKNWDSKGITVIDVGGKTKLDRPLVVFRKIGIHTYVVFDGDAHKTDARDPERNRLLIRLLGGTPSDYPDTSAYPSYAVMRENTERELKGMLGDEVYARIADSVATDLGYAGSTDAMKNVEAAAMFASRVYEAGHALSLFESIVVHATGLSEVLAAPALPTLTNPTD